MTRSKELVSYSWKPLSPEASTFPHTHTHTHTHTTSYANNGNLLHIRVQTNPSPWGTSQRFGRSKTHNEKASTTQDPLGGVGVRTTMTINSV